MSHTRAQNGKVSLHTLAKALGWFSIALGAAELLAPRAVSRAAGLQKHDGLIRGYGLRELATGAGLLLSSNPKPWLWARVAGDVADMATVPATADKRKQGRLGTSVAALLAVGALDLYAAWRSGKENGGQPRTLSAYRDYSGRSGFPRPAAEMRGARSAPRRPGVERRAAP